MSRSIRPCQQLRPATADSPGAARRKLGFTLTQIKAAINEPCAKVTVMLDDLDLPTGESVTEMVRDTRACTLRRRGYTKRGLLGHTKFMRRPELKALAAARKQRRKNPVSMSMVVSKTDLKKKRA